MLSSMLGLTGDGIEGTSVALRVYMLHNLAAGVFV